MQQNDQVKHARDQQAEQVSAWMDDQLTSEESQGLIQSLQKDATLTRQWDRWHLIGDVMRTESLARGSTVAQRVAQQLDSEPVHFPTKKTRPLSDRRRRLGLAYGVASAAAIAFVAFVAFTPQMQDTLTPTLLAGKTPAQPITPSQLEDPRLRELLDAHGAMALRPVSVELR
jgi:sigma-E factor negative regulatory protein RseA